MLGERTEVHVWFFQTLQHSFASQVEMAFAIIFKAFRFILVE